MAPIRHFQRGMPHWPPVPRMTAHRLGPDAVLRWGRMARLSGRTPDPPARSGTEWLRDAADCPGDHAKPGRSFGRGVPGHGSSRRRCLLILELGRQALWACPVRPPRSRARFATRPCRQTLLYRPSRRADRAPQSCPFTSSPRPCLSERERFAHRLHRSITYSKGLHLRGITDIFA